MKIDLMTVAVALCLVAGPALAQQTVAPLRESGSNLVRSCTQLSAEGDCGIGLPNRPSERFDNSLMGSRNTLMNQSGSGLGGELMGAGSLSANGPTETLSRGISNGMAGSETSDPLGIDSEALMRSMSGGSPGGSLGGSFNRSLGGHAAGPLSGGSHSLGHRR